MPTGVTGKEYVLLVETEDKTLMKENCLDVEGLSCCPEEGVPGIRRTVLSPSEVKPFVLRLLCEKTLLIDDFVLVEFGLGGRPALAEPGLDKACVLAEGIGLSKVLTGICKDARFGRRELCACTTSLKVFASLSDDSRSKLEGGDAVEAESNGPGESSIRNRS